MKLAESTAYALPFFLQLFLLGQAPEVWILRVSYNRFFCHSSKSGVGVTQSKQKLLPLWQVLSLFLGKFSEQTL